MQRYSDRSADMRRFVRLQRSVSRLLILAMLAVALFPALGQATSASGRDAPGWVEVCTVGGVEHRLLPEHDPLPVGPRLLVEHCPFCLVPSFDDLLPPAQVTHPVAVDGVPVRVDRATTGPRPSPAWPAAHARAPPLAS